ncbi:unnamed protein product [Hymenolepis diminuta]|uniref:Uncharacterized protein n=1 Tax=Hymenolepis diminuta TaxID=6216 RepID=A0A564Y6I1_HYMDI|nr:unnamed protein product [Hymenolepis diminuta]
MYNKFCDIYFLADSHVPSLKDVTSKDPPPYHSSDSGTVFPNENVVHYLVSPISQTINVSIANVCNKTPPIRTPPTPHGRIFVADGPSDFLNEDSTSTSSSSSPLIDQFKEEFSHREVQPISAIIRPTAQVVSPSFDRKDSISNNRTQSANAHRSWHTENSSLEENWSQLRRHASRCSVQSEYGESGRSPGVGYSHGYHRHRYTSIQYCGRGIKKNSDAVHPFASGQQPQLIRSTHSANSLDTALLLRDSQEALNEIARRIYRQPTHPTVPAAPIQLPQLQNLSSYLAHRYVDSNIDKNPLSPLSQLAIGELGTQSIDRSLVGGKSTNQQSRNLFTTAHSFGQNVAHQSVNNTPYSPPISAPPISPVSIASATEPGHPFRSGRRPAKSNRYVVRRHSLRNSNNQRVDSPTPDDIFPAEHENATPVTHTHPLPNHTAPKVVTEIKAMPSRPTGISVTTTVAPLVLQRRPEADTKHCKLSLKYRDI